MSLATMFILGLGLGTSIMALAWRLEYLCSTEYLWQRWTAWLFDHDIQTWNEVQALYGKFCSPDKGWRAMK